MIPKDKAKAMIEMFVNLGLSVEQAKMCAITALNEVISSTDWPYTLFYEDVKQEVESHE